MANSDKNIVITPNTGTSSYPAISFTGSNASPITASVLDTGAVSFSATAGQLFSISDGLSGSIFSVNDISGIPSIEVLDTGLVKLNQYGGSTVFGASAAIQNGSSVNAKLSVYTASATTPGLIIKGFASQTASLQEWQNSSGTALALVNSSGGTILPNVNLQGRIFLLQDGATTSSYNASKYYISWYNGGIGIIPNSAPANTVSFTIKGTTSQTANLQEWQNSAATVLAFVNSQGTARFAGLDNLGLTAIGTSISGTASLLIDTNITTRSGIVIKGAASQTASLQEWQNSSGTVLAKVLATGTLDITPSSGDTINFRNSSGGLTLWGGNSRYYMNTELQMTGGNWVDGRLGVDTSGAANKGIVVRGSNSQTANLQEWQNSVGTVLTKVDAAGDITIPNGISTSSGVLTATGFQSGYAVGIGLARATGSANLAVTTGSTTNVGILVRSVASQINDLQEWQNSSGTILSSITSNGFLNTPAILENPTISATAATGTINYDLLTNKSVAYYTTAASANWTLNVRGSSSATLDSLMAVGQSLTIVFMVNQGTTAYYQSGFQIDGTAVTPKWQGGLAPTFGNASGVDAYSITIMKTASATFSVFESQTRFA
jgi:hypothetical protein